MRRRVLATAVLACVLVLVSANGAWGNVKDWYEWKVDPATGKPLRSLQIWCGSETTPQWSAWMNEAIANWNNANTGWNLSTTNNIEDAEVTFHQASIPPNSRGQTPAAQCQTDFDGTTGEVIGATVIVNTDLTWGTSGDGVYDPVKAIKHELGHTMRLTHSELGNLMDDTLASGDHDCTPNLDDVDEAKDAAQLAVTRPGVAPEGERDVRMVAGEDSLRLSQEDYFTVPAFWEHDLNLVPLSGVMMPDPLAVPEGLERVVAAAGIFPLKAEFMEPARLGLGVDPAAVSGLGLVGELHWDLLPAVDMAGMVPVAWHEACATCVSGCWEAAPVVASYDPETGLATLDVSGGGIYGVAAPVAEQDEVAAAAAFTDVGPAADPLVAASLTELKAMNIYRGYPDGSAGPGRALTRLEFITLAVRVAGGEQAAFGLASQRPTFIDEIPAWGWGYVNEAVALELTRGYPDGTFRPDQNVTGNEAVTILVRLLGGQEEWIAQQTTWPDGYIDVATELGLLEGISALVADLAAWRADAITRGEMAVVTGAAIWADERHLPGGAITEGASLAAAGGWWRDTVTVDAAMPDGRRWLLKRPVVITAGEADVMRLDVDATLYIAPGAGVPDPELGATATVIGHGPVVEAVLDGGGE